MTRYTIKIIQIALNLIGYNSGKVDGILGPKTRKAIVNFKLGMGLNPTYNVNRIIKRELFNKATTFNRFVYIRLFWLEVASLHLNAGVFEYKGEKHNSKIVAFFKKVGSRIRNDETHWCAAFVGSIFEDCYIKSTRKLSARSYCQWGQKLDGPAVGAVVVFWRGSKLGWSGHVGFVKGKDSKGRLMVLGGNQGNAVNVKSFSTKRVLSYRWPLGVYKPQIGFSNLPVIDDKKEV